MGRGKKTIICIVLLIILSISVSALNISKTSYDVASFKDIVYDISTKIHNDENITLYNIQMQDINYFNFPVIDEINYNETLDYNFSAYSNETLDINLASKLIWFYKEFIETDVDTYEINVTSSGFVPNDITIDGNDFLIFKNKDSMAHTISEYGDEFSFSVSENQQYNFSRDVIENYTVVDETTGYVLNLNILNKSSNQLVHYSNKDIPLSFHLVTQYPSSSLNIEYYTDTFSVDYNGYVDGVMQVTALDDSFNVKLALPWTTFSSNNFPLAKDQSKIITFRISPSGIDKTSETNKTYQYNMNVSSSNTPFYQHLMKITIPYVYLGEDESGTKVKIIEVFDTEACYSYCDKYPDKCPLKTETKVEYILQKQNITLSEKQLNEMFEENKRLRNKLESQTGELTTLKSGITEFKQNISGDISDIKDGQKKNEKTQEDRNISVSLGIIGSIIIISTIALLYIVPKIFKRFKTSKMKEQGLI